MNHWICDKCKKEIMTSYRCSKCGVGVCRECLWLVEGLQICLDCLSNTSD